VIITTIRCANYNIAIEFHKDNLPFNKADNAIVIYLISLTGEVASSVFVALKRVGEFIE